MAFETGKLDIACEVCGTKHRVQWHRIPFRERQVVKCTKCYHKMIDGAYVRDFDDPERV